MSDAPVQHSARAKMKRRLYIILEAGKTNDLPSQIFDWFMVVLIMTNVLAFAAETVPSVEARWGPLLNIFNVVSILIFTVEYVLRLWVCTEHPPLRHMNKWMARGRFALHPMMIIDLIVILPFYLNFILGIDLRVLRVLRLLRYLELIRYSPALQTLANTFYNERRALAGSLVIMFGLLLFSATALYLVEGETNPDFATVPDAMWWAIATLTTVGYGDVVPDTTVGRVLASVVMVLGLGMFALPIGIIATGFSQEMQKRQFVVNWGLIARVPLFADLDAAEIAEVMTLVRTQVIPPQTAIVRQGAPADAMYFLALGRAQAEFADQHYDLSEGDHFGEIALLRHVEHVATVRAISQVHLLSLDADSFRMLMSRHPKLAEHVRSAAEAKMRDGYGKSSGELLEEELRRAKSDDESETTA